MGYGEVSVAGGTLDLMIRPQIVARDMLPALAAGEFYVCHNSPLHSSRAEKLAARLR